MNILAKSRGAIYLLHTDEMRSKLVNFFEMKIR
jgi:hypothetical protein